eukprot:1195510-Prorocentrum_minimum.AAC.3
MPSTKHAMTSVSSRAAGKRVSTPIVSSTTASENVKTSESEEHEATIDHSVDMRHGYEFTDAENQSFRQLSQVLMKLAMANAALGLITLCNGLINFAYSLPKIQAFSLHKVTDFTQLFSSMLTPLATLYAAYLLYSSASSFAQVVTTKVRPCALQIPLSPHYCHGPCCRESVITCVDSIIRCLSKVPLVLREKSRNYPLGYSQGWTLLTDDTVNSIAPLIVPKSSSNRSSLCPSMLNT